MDKIKCFMVVEKILSQFPLKYSKNYYSNKFSLTVVEKTMDLVEGTYDNEENIIEFKNLDALIHELFHMSFRDENKANKKVYDDENIFYGNGVSFKVKEKETIKKGHGINEGFCEYLCKKHNQNKKSTINYYFVDLLISIYGEDILKYPFDNDPIGFLTDERFYDISNFCHSLDEIQNSSDSILLISRFRHIFEEILKDSNHDDRKEVLKHMGNIMIEYRKSIISAFECIINEYKNYKFPNIDKETFTNKLNSFLTDNDYITAFAFDDDMISVKKEVTKLINEFIESKKLYKQV